MSCVPVSMGLVARRNGFAVLGGSTRKYTGGLGEQQGNLPVELLGLRPEEIKPICREIGPEGMLFQTGCRTEEEARDLLKRSENWV